MINTISGISYRDAAILFFLFLLIMVCLINKTSEGKIVPATQKVYSVLDQTENRYSVSVIEPNEKMLDSLSPEVKLIGSGDENATFLLFKENDVVKLAVEVPKKSSIKLTSSLGSSVLVILSKGTSRKSSLAVQYNGKAVEVNQIDLPANKIKPIWTITGINGNLLQYELNY